MRSNKKLDDIKWISEYEKIKAEMESLKDEISKKRDILKSKERENGGLPERKHIRHYTEVVELFKEYENVILYHV